jgi:hypothetical protein
MNIRNDLHIKYHAEDMIRTRLREAENYRMLNQLRKHRQRKLLFPFHLFLRWVGRTLTSLREKLESKEFSSVSRI